MSSAPALELYVSPNGDDDHPAHALKFKGKDLEAWQATGKEHGSVVANPLFNDAAARDFRTSAESPALTVGFVPVDYGRAGVYGDAAWKQLAELR